MALMLKAIPGDSNDPLLVPLTDSVARKHLKLVSQLLYLPSPLTFHLFRKSSATWAFQHGVSLQHIMLHGTWTSDCIWRYVSTLPQHIWVVCPGLSLVIMQQIIYYYIMLQIIIIMLSYMLITYQLVSKRILDVIYIIVVIIINIYNPILGIFLMASPGQCVIINYVVSISVTYLHGGKQILTSSYFCLHITTINSGIRKKLLYVYPQY